MARISKGPEVSPVFAATGISLLIGGLIDYFSPVPLSDSARENRTNGGGPPRGSGGGAGPWR